MPLFEAIRLALGTLRVQKLKSFFTLIRVTISEYFLIKDLALSHGRVYNEQEDALGAPVIVIGQEVAERYFPNLDPVGREIRIHRFPFTVIGVLEKQGTVFGLALDRQVIAPFHS